MSGGGLDRVRPRAPGRPTLSTDPQGKRALFSAAAPVADRPGPGSVVVECTGCGQGSVLSPVQVVKAAFPSLVLGVTVAHGQQSRGLGLRTGPRSAWLRCPACRRRCWVRLTLNV